MKEADNSTFITTTGAIGGTVADGLGIIDHGIIQDQVTLVTDRIDREDG